MDLNSRALPQLLVGACIDRYECFVLFIRLSLLLGMSCLLSFMDEWAQVNVEVSERFSHVIRSEEFGAGSQFVGWVLHMSVYSYEYLKD